MTTEDQLEQHALKWFRDTGWSHVTGTDISPEGEAPEGADFRAVVLKGCLARDVKRLNPAILRDTLLPKLLSGELRIPR